MFFYFCLLSRKLLEINQSINLYYTDDKICIKCRCVRTFRDLIVAFSYLIAAVACVSYSRCYSIFHFSLFPVLLDPRRWQQTVALMTTVFAGGTFINLHSNKIYVFVVLCFLSTRIEPKIIQFDLFGYFKSVSIQLRQSNHFGLNWNSVVNGHYITQNK